MEWRLRELEQTYRRSGRETETDVLWLVHELRRSREALVRIFARCQDADDSDATAREIRFQANEALGLYEPERVGNEDHDGTTHEESARKTSA
jgi:hypothetical protein